MLALLMQLVGTKDWFNIKVDKSQNKSVLQQMREMSGKTVSIDEMNRSVGHEKEMDRSR